MILHFPKYKSKIQTIGDGDNKFNPDKLITICVYNSVSIVEPHITIFNKIFIDEAHHIKTPEIYTLYQDEDDNIKQKKKQKKKSDSDSESENEDEFDEDDEEDEEDEEEREDE